MTPMTDSARDGEGRAEPRGEESMVERVARAICSRCGLDPSGQLQQVQGEHVKPNWKMYEDLAIAAIEALREPTEEMWALGEEEFDLMDAHWAEKLWRRMIDAALSFPGPARSSPSQPGERE